MSKQTESLESRLKRLTTRCGECLLWIGTTDKDGYGVVNVGRSSKQKAHRVAWELANGPIPSGMAILHKCDTPACVEPSHLFLGTQTDNRNDCVAKGRHVVPTPPSYRGELNPAAKHSASVIAQIRELGPLMKQTLIARRLGVTQGYVSRVLRGQYRSDAE